MEHNKTTQVKQHHEHLTYKQRFSILIAVAIGTFMGALDGSVTNITLPTISNHFHIQLSTVEWVTTVYLLVISSLILTYGRLGDLIGHKKIYITGIAVFTIGSLFCGISPTITILIISRVLQAIGAGMIMSMGSAIITDTSLPKERGKALGTIAIAVSVALALGPVLGGFLTSVFGWQSVFLINVPIGIVGLIWSQKIIPEYNPNEFHKFDYIGAVLICFSLISILFSLSQTESLGWTNSTVISLLISGVILFVIFIWQEKRIKYPMVDLKLFNNRLFSMSNLSALLNFMAQFSVVFLMPFYLQQLRGLTPSQAGLMLIPQPLVTMIIAPLSGRLSDKHDTRYISSLGMAITALGLYILSYLNYSSSKAYIIISLMIVGLGTGMFQTPNNSAIMGVVPPNRRGIASGMLATMRNIGMVMGVAISGAIFTSHQKYLTAALAKSGLAGKELLIQAFSGALHLAFLVGTALAVVAVFTSLVRGTLKPVNKI